MFHRRAEREKRCAKMESIPRFAPAVKKQEKIANLPLIFMLLSFIIILEIFVGPKGLRITQNLYKKDR